MDFHERSEAWEVSPPPPPPEFPCLECGQIFTNSDDRAVHQFSSHMTNRPLLLLRGRECGRSRLTVISKTSAEDWEFIHTDHVLINGKSYETDPAKNVLASDHRRVLEVKLLGSHVDEVFEFNFSIAQDDHLDQVESQLHAFIKYRELSIASIERFLRLTTSFASADQYRFGLANYFYGVLSREKSPESGLLNSNQRKRAYVEKFEEAANSLSQFEQPGAEAVCGLIAFHFNQFDIAIRKTRSARVSRIARRMQAIVEGRLSNLDRQAIRGFIGLDYSLSDMETERVLRWCALPLDGTGGESIAEAEAALSELEPADRLKIHIILAEHYLAAGNPKAGLDHAAKISHSRIAERWHGKYEQRARP